MRQLIRFALVLLGLAVALGACQRIQLSGTVQGDVRPQPTTAPAPLAPVDLDAIHPSLDTLAVPEGATVYQVVERMRVVNAGPGQPDKHNLWIALIGDVEPYQQVLDRQIAPGGYQLVIDEYENRYAEFDLAGIPPSAAQDVWVSVLVAVNTVSADLSSCQGELPAFFTQPELHVESANPQIVALSRQLAVGKASACQEARAYYDFVADNLTYTANFQDWGAQAALGEMGSDCTEYASLMMALSRAAGIPARYLAGLYISPNGANDLARIEHSWLEIYLPGIGWAPVDPTVGRLLQLRNTHFAAMPADHIIVTRGRNPSTLRGGNYWTHLYWPGNSTQIRVENFGWEIRPLTP